MPWWVKFGLLLFLLTHWVWWTLALLLISFVGWKAPWLLLPLIEFNSRWAQWLLQLGVSAAPRPIAQVAEWIMTAFDWLGEVGRWMLMRAKPEYREHINVVTRMYMEPGGLLAITEIAIALRLLWRRLTRGFRQRRWNRLIEREVRKYLVAKGLGHVLDFVPPPIEPPAKLAPTLQVEGEWLDWPATEGASSPLERELLLAESEEFAERRLKRAQQELSAGFLTTSLINAGRPRKNTRRDSS